MNSEMQAKRMAPPGGNYFLFSEYPDGGAAVFSTPDNTVIIFVLEGTAIFDFPFQKQILKKGYLMAIDKHLLNGCSCGKNTILIEYTPSEKFIRYLDLCKTAFRKPCSSIVPILPPVRQWIEELAGILGRTEKYTEDFWHTKRMELAFLLMDYPKEQLGEMYAALYACYKKR